MPFAQAVPPRFSRRPQRPKTKATAIFNAVWHMQMEVKCDHSSLHNLAHYPVPSAQTDAIVEAINLCIGAKLWRGDAERGEVEPGHRPPEEAHLQQVITEQLAANGEKTEAAGPIVDWTIQQIATLAAHPEQCPDTSLDGESGHEHGFEPWFPR